MGSIDELELAILDNLHQVKRVLVYRLEHVGVVAHVRLVVLFVDNQLAIGHHLF